jgi:hypothetical protein
MLASGQLSADAIFTTVEIFGSSRFPDSILAQLGLGIPARFAASRCDNFNASRRSRIFVGSSGISMLVNRNEINVRSTWPMLASPNLLRVAFSLFYGFKSGFVVIQLAAVSFDANGKDDRFNFFAHGHFLCSVTIIDDLNSVSNWILIVNLLRL